MGGSRLRLVDETLPYCTRVKTSWPSATGSPLHVARTAHWARPFISLKHSAKSSTRSSGRTGRRNFMALIAVKRNILPGAPIAMPAV